MGSADPFYLFDFTSNVSKSTPLRAQASTRSLCMAPHQREPYCSKNELQVLGHEVNKTHNHQQKKKYRIQALKQPAWRKKSCVTRAINFFSVCLSLGLLSPQLRVAEFSSHKSFLEEYPSEIVCFPIFLFISLALWKARPQFWLTIAAVYSV